MIKVGIVIALVLGGLGLATIDCAHSVNLAKTPVAVISSADVTRVDSSTFPAVRLGLANVVYAGDSKGPGEIVVVPLYTRTKTGDVVYSSPITQHNLAAFYALPGDRISGKLVGGPVKEVYTISGITRLPAKQPDGTSQEVRRPMEIATDQTTYTEGQPVRIELVIRNTGTEPVMYQFSSGQKYDFWAEKDGVEVWRWSKGKMFTQALTSTTVAPGREISFAETWDQLDNDGNAVAVGECVVMAQLTTMGDRPAPVSMTIRIEPKATAAVSLTDIQKNPSAYLNKIVTISGVYYGWRPPEGIPGCESGPPVTRSDWALSDGQSCIYVTGGTTLDPVNDRGTNVTVRAEVKQTKEGRAYLQSMGVQRGK
jgi:hypothetical protein